MHLRSDFLKGLALVERHRKVHYSAGPILREVGDNARRAIGHHDHLARGRAYLRGAQGQRHHGSLHARCPLKAHVVTDAELLFRKDEKAREEVPDYLLRAKTKGGRNHSRRDCRAQRRHAHVRECGQHEQEISHRLQYVDQSAAQGQARLRGLFAFIEPRFQDADGQPTQPRHQHAQQQQRDERQDMVDSDLPHPIKEVANEVHIFRLARIPQRQPAKS